MRKAMKSRSTPPPVHVHVGDRAPIHVHVKNNRWSPAKTPQGKSRADRATLRPTAAVKTRVPWVPPGKASTRETSFKWEGPTHRLEILPQLRDSQPQLSSSALRLTDLALDEEDGLHGRINNYESKIDDMLTEVASLKTEMERQKREQMLNRHWEQLSASQKLIADQEEELAEVSKELEETERENTRLRHSMEKILVDTGHRSFSRVDTDRAHQDKETLLKKLMDAEADGAAAAKQISALRESVSKLCCASRPTAAEVSVLAHQKDLLLQKLEAFEATNHKLRRLLREHHGSKMESLRLSEQKETLLKKLTDTEAENTRLMFKLQEKDKEMHQLSRRLEAEKDNIKNTSDWSKSLESTRAHLQGQLRSKQAENNRMCVQIKNLERAAERQRSEMERLKETMTRQRQQASVERETLKRAARAQKQQAQAAGQLSTQLMDMEKRMADALCTAECWQSHHTELVKEKNDLEMKVSLMNSRVMEMTQQLQSTEEKTNLERQALLERLHGLNTEGTAAKMENQALKAKVSAMEEKLALSLSELQQVKVSVKQYESLLDSYKIQVGKTRAEADKYAALLTQAEREAQDARDHLDHELTIVRRDMQGRLSELESLPEALRRTELQLHEARDRERSQERRGTELSSTMAELRMKVETQGNQLELCRQKNKVLLDENRQLQQRVESLETSVKEATGQNQNLLGVISKRENSVHSNHLLLEEKKRECSMLRKKLDEALVDARRQVSDTRERVATKEFSTQAKIVDLESQLNRSNTQISQLRCSKEEAERLYQSQLEDLKDRLEQTDTTNKSLNNYVQFLRDTYANVFGDVTLGSSVHTYSPVSSRQ